MGSKLTEPFTGQLSTSFGKLRWYRVRGNRPHIDFFLRHIKIVELTAKSITIFSETLPGSLQTKLAYELLEKFSDESHSLALHYRRLSAILERRRKIERDRINLKDRNRVAEYREHCRANNYGAVNRIRNYTTKLTGPEKYLK